MKRHVEPPKKKNKKSLPPPPSYSLLPDEITVSYLARISRSYYPRLSLVSKRFMSLLSSNELYAERSHIGTTEQCLYICLTNFKHQCPQWFRLLVNPKKTLPNSLMTKKIKKEKTTGQMLVPVLSPNVPLLPKSTATVVGHEIYVMGGLVDGARSSAVWILDCCSHTWRVAPNMNIARENAASCYYEGKVYAFGWCKGLKENKPLGEVFDIKTNIWERLPDPSTEVSKYTTYTIVVKEGKIMFGSYSEYSKIYAYDTKQDTWESFKDESATIDSVIDIDCVIENVSYRGDYVRCMCKWYDINDGCWKEVQGLDSLQDVYKMNCGLICFNASFTKLVSYGGKLLLIWEEYMKRRRNIWCAEIMVEKRGGEVWGNVEWVDVVYSVPRACRLLHCLTFSI